MTSTNGGQSKIAKLIVPALERIIKNASWRRHSKLVQECKSVIELLSKESTIIVTETILSESKPDTEKKEPSHDASDQENKENSSYEVLGVISTEVSTAVMYNDGSSYFLNKDAEQILHPFHSACETLSPKVVEPALDCFQKLIATGHLRGEIDQGTSPEESSLLSKILDSVCRCYDMADESVELLVLKTLLTSVTSTSIQIHGESLLKAVRTCYNIFLGSKAPVNQTTAKASLTQMLVIVFRRMEADSSTVPVQPIVVAEVLEPAEVSATDQNIIQFVQSFITKVVQEIEVVLTPSLSPGKHDGAFDAVASSPKGDLSLDSEKEMLDLKYWDVNLHKEEGEQKLSPHQVLGIGETEKDGEVEVHISNKLRLDAFLMFRALCKLSMKNPPLEGVLDPFAVRGKIVSLELLKIMLENAGAVFRTNERFLGAIKQYLCLSLLKNCASSLMTIFQLSCSIFMSLLTRFRAGLKAEIGVFFPMIVLRVVENVTHANYQQKTIVLRFLEKLTAEPQVLVDLFVNYDCDVDSTNVFERLVTGLLKTAQGPPLGSDSPLTPQQESHLKITATKCLVAILRSMGEWTDKQLLTSIQKEDHLAASLDPSALELSAKEFQTQDSLQTDVSSPRKSSSPALTDAASLEQRRAYKMELQEGVNLFNKKPAKGINFLIKSGKLEDSPEVIANFLKTSQGLDKSMIGDYLGEREDVAMKVMHAYVDSFNFQGAEFFEAIRSFLNGFRLPGEAQKIDRIMEKFAERFCRCNPKAFSSADTAYVLAYAVIMLNTDAHNPMVKKKMSKADFIRNTRGIDDGEDIPEDFMGALYDRVVQNEIKLKELPLDNSESQPANKGNAGLNNFGLDSILDLLAGRNRTVTLTETSDEVVKHMQEQLKAKSGKSGSVFHSASDVGIIRPMVEVVWAPMLAGFSVPLDSSDEEETTIECLEGFRFAIHVTAVMHMKMQRDAFVSSLAKFTSLHSVADIKQKNIDAIKVVLLVADTDGNHLEEAWEHILTCVSRFEHLHLVGEGAPSDATFFAAPVSDQDKGKLTKTPTIKRKVPGRQAQFENLARGGSYDSSGGGVQAGKGVSAEQMTTLVSNLHLLEQIGSFEMSKIFTGSEKLNSEGIIAFVKALCKVSLEELRSSTEPRVFSLTKIVEIAHFNMARIRLVWSHIWTVLSDYFVSVGCMPNLRVAMYAIDSLRQLAMKFLEREELANYNFQNAFLKPFLAVMRRTDSVEIRELIIRCMSQMVFARVASIKSGWKIMFMVFTSAAGDDHKAIVLLAFETIEKIVREYFPYITETETTTFTDCVNCLIAFTNSRFNQDVSLNAIAFLRFCALKLAEGDLGVGGKRPALPITDKEGTATFTDRVDHIYFWFPLLAGLSELTFDPRPDIRKSALEVLFDTLRFHGHMFSPALWERVFDSVLFPIFDYVRRASEPGAGRDKQDGQGLGLEVHKEGEEAKDDDFESSEKEPAELEMDAWLYETCTLALQLVVDLFVKFYTKVSPLLNRILNLLTGFIKRPHQSLAAIGVAALVRLTNSAGELFSEEKWDEVLAALQDAAESTLPDLEAVVKAAEEYEGEEEDNKLQKSQGTQQNQGSVEDDFEEGQLWPSDGQSTLPQAVADVRCKIAVQLLLVQAMTEIYSIHGGSLKASFGLVFVDTLERVATHAHQVNSDRILRFRLQQLRATTLMPDPPLLRLEGEAFHAYLNLVQQLPKDKPELATQVDVDARLVKLCQEVLKVYLSTASGGLTPLADEYKDEAQVRHWAMPLGSARRRELVSRAPLVVAILRAIGALEEASFKKHLPEFFELVTELVGCEHGSNEVQQALHQIFTSRVGPLLLGAA